MRLDFEKEHVLENARVKLRPLKVQDYDNLIEYALNEPTLWDYSLTPANGTENMKHYIDLALKKRQTKDSYPFIVFDKRANKYTGSTRFYDYNALHQSVQLGYTWYGKEFHGTGLNKNCKFLMLEFAFEKLELERVEFRADNNNARSIAAMKSIGCTVEGILRSNCKSATGRRDSIILSILKEEWFSKVKDTLSKKC